MARRTETETEKERGRGSEAEIVQIGGRRKGEAREGREEKRRSRREGRKRETGRSESEGFELARPVQAMRCAQVMSSAYGWMRARYRSSPAHSVFAESWRWVRLWDATAQVPRIADAEAGDPARQGRQARAQAH
eukprot:74657-Pleurochrysis_carterae.AAC.1